VTSVGIVTFHRASNYGAILQTYALQHVLNDLGAKTEVVDYRGETVEIYHRPKHVIKRSSFLKAPLRFYQRLANFKNFENFREKSLPLSKKYDSDNIADVDGKYDILLTGSDQVWNDEFSGLDPVYQLEFVKRSRKLSYACSFGFSDFPEGTAEQFKENLDRLETISVREKSAKSLVEEKLGLKARVDIDPTLLLKADDWRELSEAPSINEKYILIYTIQPQIDLFEAARKKAAETGMKIVFLNNSYKGNRDFVHARYSTPEEFLGWFDGASYVFTNSFHGTVFSVLFEKEFFLECRTKTKFNNRSKELLELLGLQSRKLEEGILEKKSIDWSSVRARLKDAKEESLNYLKSIVAENERGLK
jgi:hypothetical protein